MNFESLGLKSEILSALKNSGYTTPTPIQAAAIPLALAGRDILATAQTGTGKTAAFALPILERLPSGKGIKALILSPTRELAQQIETNIKEYSKNLKTKVTSIVGGLPINKQINDIKDGADILVATPGRLLDLIQRRAVSLSQVKFFVLDEADRMLDMGFVHDVRDIARKLKTERQTFLFSATISGDVLNLSRVLLKNPERVSVDAPQSVGDNITQKVYFVDREDKRDLAVSILSDLDKALVFTTTKSNANVLASVLVRRGIKADAIHSDKTQKARQETLSAFANGEISVLVATDVMARGIDVDGITHVLNYELPRDPENFVHRIGRTARAGSSGVAISFCDITEVSFLKSIEGFTNQPIEVETDHPYHSSFIQTLKDQRPMFRR